MLTPQFSVLALERCGLQSQTWISTHESMSTLYDPEFLVIIDHFSNIFLNLNSNIGNMWYSISLYYYISIILVLGDNREIRQFSTVLRARHDDCTLHRLHLFHIRPPPRSDNCLLVP